VSRAADQERREMERTRRIERAALVAAQHLRLVELERAGAARSEMAQRLGLSRPALYRRLRALGLTNNRLAEANR
jgi:DNA-binding NtrC family response regulator